MLQIHFLVLFLTLFSVSDLKLVAAEHNSSEPLPFPLFKNYNDFQDRSSEYNSSIYYVVNMESKTACVCERNLVLCYTTSGHKVVKNTRKKDSNDRLVDFEFENDFKCIDCLIQSNVFFFVCVPVYQFPIGQYLSTDIFRLTPTDQSFLTADKTIVQNFSNSTQTGMSTSYSKAVSSTDELEFGLSLTLKAETKIKVPLVTEATVGFELEGHFSQTHSDTVTTTVTAPAQTISLQARKQITINYALYRTKLVNDCLVNFVIDDRGGEEKSDTRPSRFRFLREQFHKGIVRFNLNPFEYKAGLKLTKEGVWHLLHYPTKEKVEGHVLHIIYGDEEPVYGSQEVGPNTHVIMMNPYSHKRNHQQTAVPKRKGEA